MFEKLQRAFWKALTPDLIPETAGVALPAQGDSGLNPAVLAALGGSDNLKSQQPLALTRVRVELRDPSRLDPVALVAAGVPGIMPLAGGVVHLLLGLRAG